MLTQKQETFSLNLFQGMSNRDSWIAAGYSHNYSLAVLDVNACRLAASTKVQLRVAELRKKAEDAAVSTVGERKKILTEIQRARFGDFADENGNLQIDDKAKLRNAAIQEIKTERTLTGIRTTLKLRDPVAAIAEHNKMDKIYSESPTGNTYNTQYNIIVPTEQGRELLQRVLKGEGTENRQLVSGTIQPISGENEQ